ncbi:MAG: pilus assembly protein [Salinarchaeum sp.]
MKRTTPTVTHPRNPGRPALRRPKGLLIGAALGAMITGPSIALAEVDLAQAPLIVGSDADPNLTLIIDDSGSMNVEVGSIDDFSLPDEDPQDTGERRVFPQRAGPFGNYPLHNATPTFDDDNPWNYRARSAAHNPLFYDPEVDYEPWVDFEGNPYPEVDPTNAAIDPTVNTSEDQLVDPGATGHGGPRDLTTETTEQTNWLRGDNTVDQGAERTFWPITYFIYEGPDNPDEAEIEDRDNYERIEVREDDVFIDGNRATEADLQDRTGRTIDEEIQNFANWHTYFRDRKNSARAGIGRAFQILPERFRLGYGTINSNNTTVDGQSERAVTDGVRALTEAEREAFYERLYSQDFDGGTPLREALAGVGDYYTRDDDQGPWSETPGEAGGDPDGQLECRLSYTMLMTDGEWDPDSTDVGNVDGSDGPTISSPEGDDFQYTPEPPFEDNNDDMLADVAMEYWNRDLRGDLDNIVPTTNANPAFWQHMVTFTIGFGVAGELDPETDLDDLEDGSEEWTDNRVDDLWHAAINGRGEFLNATRPEAFRDGMAGILDIILGREEGSSASVATTSTEATSDSLFFQALFDSEDWTGSITAFEADDEGSVDEGSVAWAADDGIPGPDNRAVFTIDPSNEDGIDFAELDDLTDDQQDALGDDDALGDAGDLAEYLLLGEDGREQRNGGPFRDRPDTVLGDIVNSEPEVTRTNNRGYSIFPDNEGGDEYAAYLNGDSDSDASKEGSSGFLYVGANDGMLHAFDASETGGDEVFAFAPNAVFDDLPELADPDYTHQFFVDGQVKVDDAYIGDDWRRILVASAGAGAQSVFALDVTDPENFGEDDVLWELDGDDLDGLGNVMGEAHIVKLNNDEWAAVFGNGYNSEDGTPQLMIVPLEDPDAAFAIEPDGKGGAPSVGDEAEGLGGVTLADTDGDGKPERAYGGDLDGNLWRFDLSDSKRNKWGVDRLFKAERDDDAQPITAAPAVDSHSDSDIDVNVLFGTGQFVATGDNEVGDDPRVETFYSVHDTGSDSGLTRDDLFDDQEILSEGTSDGEPFRVIDDEEAIGDESGWLLDLVVDGEEAEGERVVDKAEIVGDRVFFRTLIPNDDPCAAGGESWLMELDAERGTRSDIQAFEDVDPDASGVGSQELVVGLTTVIRREENQARLLGSNTQGGVDEEETDIEPGLFGRQSWRELR